MNPITRYARWLHTQWPAGTVEKLPFATDDGLTNVSGVYIVGDLRGVPLLKFAVDSGARAVQHIVADTSFRRAGAPDDGVWDLVIVGAGVAGVSAAIEASLNDLSFVVLEASEPFSTVINFPRAKPIFTYPKQMIPAGEMRVTADVKEALIDELEAQAHDHDIRPTIARVERLRPSGNRIEVVVEDGENYLARRVILALGRSGDFRRLDVPGENLDKVTNRLHDPSDFRGRDALVVGGGDSAVETAIALARSGARVTLGHRGAEFSRAKAENVDALRRLSEETRDPATPDKPIEPKANADRVGDDPTEPRRIRVLTGTRVEEIRPNRVIVKPAGGEAESVPNDVVFTMLGREAPLDFLRRSGIRVAGDWQGKTYLSLAGFLLFCLALYNWKSGGWLSDLFYQEHWFPVSLSERFATAVADPSSFLGVLVISASGPAFWYTLVYCVIVVTFGIRRIRKRKTPYITAQTCTLMAIQVLPLFLLPEIILPLLDKHGLLPSMLADNLFPAVSYGHGREFWRAYGLVLAWPLNVYNVFTDSPLAWWLVICFVQTFVLIPILIYFWGKGAYCGWICSCGALAETLGDGQRHKMVHGRKWNRVNMVGQGILLVATLILLLRVLSWIVPSPALDRLFFSAKENYKWIVDVFLAGVIGYGLYFWFSGRVWCRFMCPLAALMHIYARFSRFRILSDKKKCISCNVCTSVCHQGIDIMNFANKGTPMEDPQCVRCSACVHSCPTGVLTFGRVDRHGQVLTTDRLAASPVRMTESAIP